MPTTTTEAQDALATARAHHAELEDAIRDGNDTITAAQLADATAEIRTAELRLEAAERAEQRTAEAARAHEADVVRQEFEHLTGKGSEKARKAYAAAVAALRTLTAEANGLRDTRAALQARASMAGVDLPFWDSERVVTGGGEVYTDRALKEARGHMFTHAHALHDDKHRAEFAAAAERAEQAERERHERFMANTEVTDDLGRRVVVGD
ncbi:hypothetical protein [Gordonia sputi]|uniref:hypothetical protein n=1 Tax=Gordonia sputi TaxID=36823 RepID=UPI00226E4EA9|nr:hypothetical protein [Gordonia sputi]